MYWYKNIYPVSISLLLYTLFCSFWLAALPSYLQSTAASREISHCGLESLIYKITTSGKFILKQWFFVNKLSSQNPFCRSTKCTLISKQFNKVIMMVVINWQNCFWRVQKVEELYKKNCKMSLICFLLYILLYSSK